MSNFEDRYKAFHQDHQDMAGIDADAIWNGVESELASPKKRPAFWFLGVAVLLLLGVAGTAFWYASQPTESAVAAVRKDAFSEGYIKGSTLREALIGKENAIESIKISGQEWSETAQLDLEASVQELNTANGHPIQSTKQSNTKAINASKAIETSEKSGSETEIAQNKNDKQSPLPATDESPKNGSNLPDIESSTNKGAVLPVDSNDSTQNSPPKKDKESAGLERPHFQKGSTAEHGGAKGGKTEISLPGQVLKGTENRLSIPQGNQDLIQDLNADLVLMEMLRPTLNNIPIASNVRPSNPLELENPKRGFLPDEMAVFAGMNRALIGFSDQDAGSQVAKSTIADYGWNASLNAHWIFSERWRVGIGLHYQIIQTQFDYSKERRYTDLLPNQLVGFETDTAGLVSPVYGNKQVDVLETRTVLHHNRYNTLSIPLLLGVQQTFGRHTFGADLGVAYRFMIQQNGRSLDQDGALAAFDSSNSASLAFEPRGLSLGIHPFYSMDMNERFACRIGAAFDRALEADSPLLGNQRMLSSAQVNFGLVWKLP